MSSELRPLLLAASAFAALTGCAVHADLKPLPSPDAPALALEQTAGKIAANASGQASTPSNGAWPEEQWWTAFGDPQLSALVSEGLAASPNMDVALARLEAARARVSAAHSDLLPGIEGNFSALRSRYSENGFFPPPIGGETLSEYKGEADLRWDLDFWGRQRSALRAARRGAEAAEVDAAATRLMVSESIARRYIEWQHLEDQLVIARALLEQRGKLLALTARRVRAGLDTNVELHQAEGALPDTRATVTALEAQVSVVRMELAALVGSGPDRALALQPPKLAPPASLMGLPTVVPAELLARRADVVSTRLKAESAAAGADAARADLLPNINLVGSLGLDSTDISKWLDYGSRFYSVGPSLKLPIFNTGRHAALRLRTSDYEEAAASYRQTLIDAVRDVAAALSDLRAAAAQQEDAAAAVEAGSAAYSISEHRYQAGLDAYTQVLLSEARLLSQRQRVADLNAARLDATVKLIAALGGGLPLQPSDHSESSRGN